MVQRHSLRRNIDLLFLFEDVNEKEEEGEKKKKKDKLRDRYWFHPVQIEGSPIPSSSDFKGL
jgi:hypothetical protein